LLKRSATQTTVTRLHDLQHDTSTTK